MRPFAAIRPLRACTTMSMPAKPASGPRLPKAVTEPTIRRGCRFTSSSAPSPIRSARPGRKFMSATSASCSSALMTVAASGCRRFSGSERLPRLREMNVRVSMGASGRRMRVGSPSSDSILMTSAPPSASNWAQNGTATNWPNSMTRTPWNGCWSAGVGFIAGNIALLAGAAPRSPSLGGVPLSLMQQLWAVLWREDVPPSHAPQGAQHTRCTNKTDALAGATEGGTPSLPRNVPHAVLSCQQYPRWRERQSETLPVRGRGGRSSRLGRGG